MKVTTKIRRVLDNEFQILLQLQAQGRYVNDNSALKRDLVDILKKVMEIKD